MKTLYLSTVPRPAHPVRAIIEKMEKRVLMHGGHDGTYINVGGPAFTDSQGHAWRADQFFAGGELRAASYDVTGTPDDAVYAARRFGAAFSYAIPVSAAGTYRVTLLFAEPWFTVPGQRVFNVSAEGAARLSNFDILSAAPTYGAASRSFDVAVNDGTLNLAFTGVTQNAVVSGIAVERAAQVPVTPASLTATAFSPTQVDLRWSDRSTEETGFSIERSTNGASFTSIATVAGNVTAYSNRGLSPGVTYTYRVRATSAAGASAPSDVASARTATTGTQTPFGSAPIRLPATIQAENFDHGGAGIAYNDVTPMNAGSTYRDTPVDIYELVSATTGAGGYAVGSTRRGEWLEYTFDVAAAANFSLELKFASGSRGGVGHVSIDGVWWDDAITFPNTGGWTRYTTIPRPAHLISAGKHVLRLTFDRVNRNGDDFGDVDWIRFSSVGGASTAPAAPANFAARGVGDTQVNLGWSDVATNESNYLVQRKLLGGSAFATIATLPPETEWYADQTAVANATYLYRVIASNAGGGGMSNEIQLGTWLSESFRWRVATVNPMPRYEAAGAAANGKLYVFGGYVNPQIQATARVDAYDPARNTWAQLRDMPEVVTHAGQAVEGNAIYLAGGFVGDHPGLGTTSVWRYDTTSDTWSRMPSLPAPRGAGALVRAGRSLFFFGGLIQAQFVTVNQAEHWSLDLNNPSAGWVVRAAMPNARNHLAGVELGGKVYAVGGQDVWNEMTGARSNVDVYDPATNIWTAAAPLPVARSHISASTFSMNGEIYVVGGATNNLATVRDVTSYDPATNSWTPFRELLGPRLTPVAGVVGRMLIVSTGTASGLRPRSETWVGLLD